MAETFGQRLRRIRERRLMTLRELGKKAGVSWTHLAKLEHDQHRPTPSTVRKLAAALGVDPAWLLFGEGQAEADQSEREPPDA
ncbi:MAG: helix-turn-helix transcriptional regulator [Thermomicrobium sp.]|nr:helix-turn-helix transcriptional regulator [Thermomicrobium sp.]MDW8006639.1 helix-turn-helix transcriptional regulator [Thermomicrobium sp.]